LHWYFSRGKKQKTSGKKPEKLGEIHVNLEGKKPAMKQPSVSTLHMTLGMTWVFPKDFFGKKTPKTFVFLYQNPLPTLLTPPRLAAPRRNLIPRPFILVGGSDGVGYSKSPSSLGQKDSQQKTTTQPSAGPVI